MRRTVIVYSKSSGSSNPWLAKLISVMRSTIGRRDIPAVKDFKQYQKTAAQSAGKAAAQAQYFAQKQWEEFKSQLNSSSSSSNSNRQDTAASSSFRGSNGSEGSSSSDQNRDNTTAQKKWAEFTDRAYKWWSDNKEQIKQFVGANFVMVIFLFQFGSQIGTMLMQLVYTYTASRQENKIREQKREEHQNRQKEMEEIQQDLSDDIYSSKGVSVGTNSNMDENELRKRLERREKRRTERGLSDMQIHFHESSEDTGEQVQNRVRTINERQRTASDEMKSIDHITRRLVEEEETREVESILRGGNTKGNQSNELKVRLSRDEQEEMKKRKMEEKEERKLANQIKAKKEFEELQFKQNFQNSFSYKMSDSGDEDHQFFGLKHDDTQKGTANYNEYTNGSRVSFSQKLYSSMFSSGENNGADMTLDANYLVDPLTGKPLSVTRMDDVENKGGPLQHVFDFRNPKGIYGTN
eukprot:Tbor_TRINITY_DN5399_c3_g1::TRINITY_DN5399_c3_g1_i2::g.4415::m.4415